MKNDKVNKKGELWGTETTNSQEKLSTDFSSKVVAKTQRRTVFIDFLFMIVIGFKEILAGLIPRKNPQLKK